MEKVIWVIDRDRKDMIRVQRQINSTGSMRAFCMLSYAAVRKAVEAGKTQALGSAPSLIIFDYDSQVREDFASLSFIKKQQALAGVPVFFMTEIRTAEIDDLCFEKGAMVVLHKPFSDSGILRIERVAWQHEVTKNYEKVLQKQAGDLQAAREIVHLNEKLKKRNALLYQIFGRYFSDKVLEVILEHPEGAALGGEKRDLTVMMSDLRGFTSLSEEMEPEAVTSLLNFYFGRMVEIINSYRGTVIEFMGDGILAVFGAPIASEYHTADAVAAAIAMQNRMGEVNAYCEEHGYPVLEMGIGIHRGEAFIGNVGSEKMMRYNVVGRIVNECSRIEGCSVGGQVLVSREALDTIKEPVEIQNQMHVTAKGIHKPLTVCEVTGIGGAYQSEIENVEPDVLQPVKDFIVFNLYRIEDKMVSEESVTARLRQFSGKRAIVELEPKEMPSEEENLQAYSDVEIHAAERDGKTVFNGVYAKIIERKDRSLVLHFTHVNHGFRRLTDKLREEE